MQKPAQKAKKENSQQILRSHTNLLTVLRDFFYSPAGKQITIQFDCSESFPMEARSMRFPFFEYKQRNETVRGENNLLKGGAVVNGAPGAPGAFNKQ